MSVNATNGAGAINLQNLQSLDLETALMMVQSERTKLLDSQLQTQIQEVQNRNELSSKLNTALNAMNTVLNRAGTNAADKPSSATDAEIAAVKTAFKDAGITDVSITKDTKRSDIETAITKVKGQIDALGNTQQMDMLRLQSMSNKRNEAFDVMTNFVKKMQESRSSIIGNMR
ncbi:hypothetical protein [Pigmentiphaga aceris]|uniref:hypothetical protein n=1 Tax=Pigmentiphaga aceris TaxID=1940612 RepID=UPI00165255F0|nr:hypothetical protein [Pigmentiphaga aceris]